MRTHDDAYDRCPVDGCLETERRFAWPGHWAIYHADPRRGGCGANWSRTTRQGVARDAARGVRSRWPTEAAARGRVWSVPSAAYRRNFDRAFGRGEEAP